MASISLSLRPISSVRNGSRAAVPMKIRPQLGWSSRTRITTSCPSFPDVSHGHTCPMDANLSSSMDSTCTDSTGKQPLHVPVRALAAAAMIVALGFQALTPQSALAAAAGSMVPQPSTTGQTPKADIYPGHIAAISMSRANHNKAGALFYVLHYRMLQVLSLPTVGKVAALVAVGAPLVVGGAAMHRWASGAPWPESLLKVYYVLNSVPGIDISAEESKRAVFVLNLMHVASLFTFAILVGILTDEVARGVEAVRTGNHAVPEKHHTVILGWDRARTPMLLQQLLQAQAERGHCSVRPPFVLLLDPARCSKEEVDQLLEDKMGLKLGRVVVTRQGSALRPDDLKRVSAGQAGTIIVTANPSTDSQLDSTSTLLATLAALHSVADPKTKQSVVVETSADVADWDTTGGGGSICRMLSSQNRRVTTVTEAKEVSEIIAQTALHAGISGVFEEVCVQGVGHSEFYIKKQHDFVGRTFRDARLSYPGCLLTGTVSRTTRVARLSPPEGYVLQPEDCLVFLAQDDQHIAKVSNPAAYEPAPLPAPIKAIEAAPPPHVVVLMHDAVDGAIQLITSLTTVGRDRPHITLVGKSPEQTRERHAVEAALSSVRHAGCKTEWIKEDCASQAASLMAGVATAQAVVIAPPGESWGPDDTDAQVLACALQVLDVLHHSTSHRDAPLRLVAGIMTDGTRQVIKSMTASAVQADRPNHAMVAELLLKDRLMTGLLGQVATEPLLRGVFEELLSQEGAELYTRTQEYFDLPVDTPMTWEQVVEHVRLRGELAIGTVGQSGTVRLGSRAHDQGTLKPGTKLIVLADD